MPFTQQVKDEILRQPDLGQCCLNAFLSAVLRIGGSVASGPEAAFRINSENALLSRKLYSILKNDFKLAPHILSARSRKRKPHSEYGILLGRISELSALLDAAGIRIDESDLPEYRTYFTAHTHGKLCCRRAYLTGAFLTSGSMNEPEKAYHCEISSHNSLLSGEVSKLMNGFGLNSRVILRKNSYVVYLKEAEGISDFLRIMHANKSVAAFENVRILKDMRNNINRTVNCETANITKTVSSSYQQADDIERIFRAGRGGSLPHGLLQIAEARLRDREASLKELGEMMEPRLSRSGVNHRLKRIAEIAEALKKKDREQTNNGRMVDMEIRDRIIAEFMELSSIDSLSLQERAMADRLLAKLAEIGIDAKEDAAAAAIKGTAGNVWGCLKGDPDLPAIILSSHMDTVSPGIGKRAVIDGDVIRSAGDTIIGADDLSGVTAILVTLRQLAEAGDPAGKHGDVYAVFTAAEEIGLCGAYHFDYAKTGAKLAIVLDSTGSPGNIVIAAPSHKRMHVTLKGRAAHAGVEPEKGVSAIRIAARAIDRMRLGRIDSETTANIGVIEGGKATNIVCDHVSVKAECRSIDLEKLELQVSHMTACFAEAAEFYGGEAITEVIREYSAFRVEKDSDAIRLVLRALEENGIEPNLFASGGGSDANVINAAGITTINIGSGMYNVHSVGEYLKIGDLISAVGVLKSIILGGGTTNE